jgi:hypothetical protein
MRKASPELVEREGKMAKAKAGAAELKDVEFNPAAGDERTEKIEVAGVKPFEITFAVPGVDAAFDFIDPGEGRKERLLGERMRTLIEHQLKRWTLSVPVGRKAIIGLPPKVFGAVYDAISEATVCSKN